LRRHPRRRTLSASPLHQKLNAAAKARSDADAQDSAALAAFCGAHGYAPPWVTATGLSPKATAAIAEIQKADDWGLEAHDFVVPQPVAAGATPEALADAEATLCSRC